MRDLNDISLGQTLFVQNSISFCLIISWIRVFENILSGYYYCANRFMWIQCSTHHFIRIRCSTHHFMWIQCWTHHFIRIQCWTHHFYHIYNRNTDFDFYKKLYNSYSHSSYQTHSSKNTKIFSFSLTNYNRILRRFL